MKTYWVKLQKTHDEWWPINSQDPDFCPEDAAESFAALLEQDGVIYCPIALWIKDEMENITPVTVEDA